MEGSLEGEKIIVVIVTIVKVMEHHQVLFRRQEECRMDAGFVANNIEASNVQICPYGIESLCYGDC